MKRIFSIILLVILLSAFFTVLPVGAASDLIDWDWKVQIDGVDGSIPTKTIAGSEITFVPLRKVFEELGCIVDYTQGYIAIQKGITAVSLQENNPYITVNDLVDGVSTSFIKEGNQEIVPKRDSEDKLYIPVRAVAEALFCEVITDNNIITIKPHYEMEECNYDRFAIIKRTKFSGETAVGEPQQLVCDRTQKKAVQFSIKNSEIADIKDLLLSKKFPVAFNVVTKDNKENYFLIEADGDLGQELEPKNYTIDGLFNEKNKISDMAWEQVDETPDKLQLTLSDVMKIEYDIANNKYTIGPDYIVQSYQVGEDNKIIFEMQYIYTPASSGTSQGGI